MITITGVGEYDDTKQPYNQSEEVKAFLLPIIDGFNAINCIEFDLFDRPLKWKFEGNSIRLTYERIYQEASPQRMVKENKFVVTSLI